MFTNTWSFLISLLSSLPSLLCCWGAQQQPPNQYNCSVRLPLTHPDGQEILSSRGFKRGGNRDIVAGYTSDGILNPNSRAFVFYRFFSTSVYLSSFDSIKNIQKNYICSFVCSLPTKSVQKSPPICTVQIQKL